MRRAGRGGLGPRDLALNVALPDNRAVADRVGFAADPARNWAGLRQKEPAERRVALILANYPNRDGRIGNGVGLDTPASAIAILEALAAAGYRVDDRPRDRRELIARLLSGPTNANPGAASEETLSFADYSAHFAALPAAIQKTVVAHWGAAERDPFFRAGRLDCGHFAIPGFRTGNVAVLVEPARGYSIDPQSTCHDPTPAPAPPHCYLAAYAWLAREFRADAVVHLGKHGTREWLPATAGG